MANQLSPYMLSSILAVDGSSDPFLTLVTLSHSSFSSDILLVNNPEDIVSRGDTYIGFPMKIGFPADDGESAREFTIQFDNVSLELIDEIRSVTDSIGVKLELIFANFPDDVQISQEDLKIQSINYNSRVITARIVLDNFLNTEVTSERYSPGLYPGVFD